MLCKYTATKYLHDLPVSFIAIILDIWLRIKSNMTLIQWILKLLQWPAIFFYRMIELPTYECIEFM